MIGESALTTLLGALATGGLEPPEPLPVEWPTWVVLLVGGMILVLMGLLAYVFVRKVGCNCPECSVRMAFFSEVPEEEKREILDYFEKYESRRPREDRLLVCPKCGLVYDDFSGEGRSLDADERSECKVCGKSVEVMAQYIISGEITQMREANPEIKALNIECLNCRRRVITEADCTLCDTPNKLYACRACRTFYAWIRPHKSRRHKFFAALTKDRLLDQAPEWLE